MPSLQTKVEWQTENHVLFVHACVFFFWHPVLASCSEMILFQRVVAQQQSTSSWTCLRICRHSRTLSSSTLYIPLYLLWSSRAASILLWRLSGTRIFTPCLRILSFLYRNSLKSRQRKFSVVAYQTCTLLCVFLNSQFPLILNVFASDF